MRIVVRCQDPRLAREAQTRLAAAKIEAAALPGPPGAKLPEGADIVIVVGGDGAAYARASRAHAPLAVLAGLLHATPPPLGLAGLEPFTGAIALDASPALLAGQIAAFERDGIASEECKRRRTTALALGAELPKPPEQRQLRALYVGAPSPLYLKLERALGAHHGLVAAAFTSFAGFDHLHDDVFDAVVLNGAQESVMALSFCAALRRNAGLYHLPTLVLTAPNDDATERAAIERGASAVMPFNASSGPSLGWLFEAIRRERRRAAAEHELRALRDIMGDPRTGLFRCAPFEAHLARLAEDHHASGRPFAIAALRVMPAHGAREPSEQVWKRGFNEIASLAGRLVRDADCGAAIGGDLIALALPATDMLAARRAAERVASVAECTAFASGETGAGPLVFEQSVAELQPGESGMGLLARALSALERESARA